MNYDGKYNDNDNHNENGNNYHGYDDDDDNEICDDNNHNMAITKIV